MLVRRTSWGFYLWHDDCISPCMIKTINPVSDDSFAKAPSYLRAKAYGANIPSDAEIANSLTRGPTSKTAGTTTEKAKFSLALESADRTAGYMPVYEATTPAPAAIAASAAIEPSAGPDAAPHPKSQSSGANDQIGFLDFLDIINPLQHLPIISNIYRSMTGDEIKPVAKIIGDSIYGGPIGAATGMITTVLAQNHAQNHDKSEKA